MQKNNSENGRRWEIEFFRKCSSIARPEIPYKNWVEAIGEVMNNENAIGGEFWDPTNPSTSMARALFIRVKNSLRRDNQEHKELRLFRAIGTTLDFWHGVDGFFECTGKVVTFDLKTGNYELRKKTHFIIRRPRDGRDLDEISEKICKAFRSSRVTINGTLSHPSG